MTTLPPALCPHGYPVYQLRDILGARFEEFTTWMRGQTVCACTGELYSHETRQTTPGPCFDAPHGTVVYAWDVRQFLRKGEPLD